MKLIFTLLAVTLTAVPCFAQGANLGFVETKYIKLEAPVVLDGSIIAQTLVVPEGQTWKVESATANYRFSSGPSTSYGYSNYIFLVLDHIVIWKYDDHNHYTFPIWLPAGTYNLNLWSDTTWTPNQYTAYGSVSILVFNIIP
ncbi:MAG: hypothetical protein SGI87_09815 [Flavobacteriales bacterium]|nr:hypothetical protein [Flavobacteriales bacterium]